MSPRSCCNSVSLGENRMSGCTKVDAFVWGVMMTNKYLMSNVNTVKRRKCEGN